MCGIILPSVSCVISVQLIVVCTSLERALEPYIDENVIRVISITLTQNELNLAALEQMTNVVIDATCVVYYVQFSNVLI